jgi:hypothetical protein
MEMGELPEMVSRDQVHRMIQETIRRTTENFEASAKDLADTTIRQARTQIAHMIRAAAPTFVGVDGARTCEMLADLLDAPFS